MDTDEDITPEQTEKLIQFQDLTGIEDMTQCKDLLKRNHWDLEVAVQHHLGEQETPEDASPNRNGVVPQLPSGDGLRHRRSTDTQSLREPRVSANNPDQRVYTFHHHRAPVGFLGWTSYIVLLPFRFVYYTIHDIFFFVFRLFRPDPRLMVTDPLGDVAQLINSYDAKYGQIHPVFYQGTYAQALNDAKNELTFLVVYLHSENNEDCDRFCRTTLANDSVIALLNARTLFWVCSVNTAEGYRVSRALQRGSAITTFPFIAMIAFRESRMSVVARFEGPVDPASFALRVSQVIDENETALEAVRADRRERSMAQNIRREQDAAYMESLLMDQEKERRKKEEEEEKRKELEASLREEEEAREEAAALESLKAVLESMAQPEPAVNDSEAIRILLKCPSGLRLERRFRKSQPIEDLFIYIFCHPETPDDFSIVKNFPRIEIPGSPPSLKTHRHLLDDAAPSKTDNPPKSFADVGLSSSEMLFVQDNQA